VYVDSDCLLLVEEQALIRTALRKLLESWTNVEIVAEAVTKDETLSAIQRSNPDVTLSCLSAKPVRHHVTAIFQKLNVASRSQLTAKLHGRGVADLQRSYHDSLGR